MSRCIIRVALFPMLACLAAAACGSDPAAGPVDTCSAGTRACAGACVDLRSDHLHCGACGNTCAVGLFCLEGRCSAGCGAFSQCGTLCVDTDSDPLHCGACHSPCGAGQICLLRSCLSCSGGKTGCNNLCVDLTSALDNCGTCGKQCAPQQVCAAGSCVNCAQGRAPCSNRCVDLQTDVASCGVCGNTCAATALCLAGKCTACPGGKGWCGGLCLDISADAKNCGACGNACAAGLFCKAGVCTGCAPGLIPCGASCAYLASDPQNCGACGKACPAGTYCFQSACTACDSTLQDCDKDGWLVSDGDCCDKPGPCGKDPELVNPGAVELLGNLLDDNCNGLVDALDTLDTQPCDASLPSNSDEADLYATALGICRQASASPGHKKDLTWGLLGAKLLHAGGAAVAAGYKGRSIRDAFGKHIKPLEGARMVLLASGVAADATQTGPGPNQGAPKGMDISEDLNEESDLLSCSAPLCVKDWFTTANPPLKKANGLPAAAGCGSGSGGAPQKARDSIMLALRIRAPTNVKAFSFSSFFFSAEYPEFVCSQYNDQLVALVDTPSGTPQVKNPPDKNLMTYTKGSTQWPIGINVAKGTDIFRVCETQAQNAKCWDKDVNATSCALGPTLLDGTGFEWPAGKGQCLVGGGTHWLISRGNIIPGQVMDLRIAIWDVGDHILDSYVLLDAFRWQEQPVVPGTD